MDFSVVSYINRLCPDPFYSEMFGGVSVNDPTKTHSFFNIDHKDRGAKAILIRYMMISFKATPVPANTLADISDNVGRFLINLPAQDQLAGQYWLDWVIEGSSLKLTSNNGNLFFSFGYQIITEGKIKGE